MNRTALRAARLFDGTTCTDDPLVLVADGRVTEVRHGRDAPVPDDAELVDLPGATLLPGLVDTHVHLSFDSGPDPVAALADRDEDALLTAMAVAADQQLAAGVTTVRDLGDRGFAALRLRERGGRLPTIVAAGPPITSPGGHCHFLGGVAEGVAGVRAAVRTYAERGVDVIKVMASGGMLTEGTDVAGAQFSAAELRVVVEEAHRHGLPVTAHAHALDAVRDAVAARVDGIEHCTCFDGERVVLPPELADAIVTRRIAIGSTVGIAPLPDGMRPPPLLAKILPGVLAAHARLIRAGALVVAGTDAGIAPPKPHGVLPRGLGQLVELGMTPLEALRAGTATAAQVCGLGERKGRVAPGYDADLLAVAGDPAADIGALLSPVAVLVAGEVVRRAAGVAS
ncbi:amidohydrolase family protein [Pseudonocardia abyssalis]|uniref:Amidohydrolase family protein n=1 Tax=Pseudonocardia abyssalis TaxID=2792008 RepID=A0ABS6UUB9_9PSEU|nr:amidohydrolase family protein [Pseudonocardia abyssalis]MBW0116261.1 amidohydrolase family protein [Pseudonocardia abyssalis]MBW0135849.1 amidohydrolase family protein [Pseudonocardia abyssalis]